VTSVSFAFLHTRHHLPSSDDCVPKAPRGAHRAKHGRRRECLPDGKRNSIKRNGSPANQLTGRRRDRRADDGMPKTSAPGHSFRRHAMSRDDANPAATQWRSSPRLACNQYQVVRQRATQSDSLPLLSYRERARRDDCAWVASSSTAQSPRARQSQHCACGQ
jgi:hypothetical protein